MSLAAPNIYIYESACDYLNDYLKWKKLQNPNFSTTIWSQQMGFTSRSTLNKFLNRKRLLRLDHLPYLLNGLSLSSAETEYLQVLIQYGMTEDLTERDSLLTELRELRRFTQFNEIEHQAFQLIADWFHLAIWCMVELEDFQNDPQWIAQRLKNKVSPNQVQEALDRLIRLDLLKIKNGHLVQAHDRLRLQSDIPSEAIRRHHEQVLQLAQKSIRTQHVDERFLESCALTIDKNKLNEAQNLILDFRNNLSKLMHKTGGEETYQLSVQFFKLT